MCIGEIGEGRGGGGYCVHRREGRRGGGYCVHRRDRGGEGEGIVCIGEIGRGGEGIVCIGEGREGYPVNGEQVHKEYSSLYGICT